MRSYTLLSILVACVAAQKEMGGTPMAGIKVPQGAISIQQRAQPTTAGGPKIQTVIVGGFAPAATPGGQPSPNFVFSPETITAQPGEVVRFMFMGNNHSVVQTNFEAPCEPAANGFNTGFKPNPQNQLTGAPTMDLPIKDTQPLYMSCLQVTHCGKGMVFSVNPPPAGDKTHTAFKQLAIRVGNPGLQNAGIQAAQPVPQVASTISIKPQGAGNAQATPGAPGAPAASVVPGMGMTGAGQACGCQCLCGAGSFPADAGIGNFGGVAGAMPEGAVPMGGMLPGAAGSMMPAGGQMSAAPAAAQPSAKPAAQQGGNNTVQIAPAAGAAPPAAPQAPGAMPAGMQMPGAVPSVPNARLRRW